MADEWTRRELLYSGLAGGSFLAAGEWLRVNSTALASDLMRSNDRTIEQLAEQIMETDPESVVALVVDKLGAGLSRQDLLAACLNAGIRFHGHHSAYVAHPVRVVSDTVARDASLLPLFYHLSVLRFRAPRASLRWLDQTRIPHPDKAESQFHSAMESGEKDDAGLAMIAMCRSIGPQPAVRHLHIYAAERNHLSGGHTAVSVVNTLRTLQATDWRCAEPALQFAVTDEAWRKPGGSQVCLENRARAAQVRLLPRSWANTVSDTSATKELVDLYRKGQPQVACQETHRLLRESQVTAGSVWDAVFLTTAEMVVRYQFVGGKRLAGHSITCSNALHYLFRNSAVESTRLYCLLEAVEWTTSFLARERARPALREFNLLSLEPADVAPAKNDGLDEIFALLPPRRFASLHRPGFDDVDVAMQKTLAWIRKHADAQPFLQLAMWLMCIKSTPEVHDFKYPMALFENCRYASATWRPLLLAASVHVLQGTEMEDSRIVHQARERLG